MSKKTVKHTISDNTGCFIIFVILLLALLFGCTGCEDVKLRRVPVYEPKKDMQLYNDSIKAEKEADYIDSLETLLYKMTDVAIEAHSHAVDYSIDGKERDRQKAIRALAKYDEMRKKYDYYVLKAKQ